MQSPSHQSSQGVVTQAQTAHHPRRDGDDILPSTAQLDADNIIGRVEAKQRCSQQLPQFDCQIGGGRRHDPGTGLADGKLRRKGRSGQGCETQVPAFRIGLFSSYLAHSCRGLGFDSLGGGNQLNLMPPRQDLQKAANSGPEPVRRHDNHEDLAVRQIPHVSRGLDAGCELCIRQVGAITSTLRQFLGQFRAPRPQPHLAASRCCMDRKGRAPRSRPQDSYSRHCESPCRRSPSRSSLPTAKRRTFSVCRIKMRPAATVVPTNRTFGIGSIQPNLPKT